MCLLIDWLKGNFLIHRYNRLLVAKTQERGRESFPPFGNLAVLKIKPEYNSWYVMPEFTFLNNRSGSCEVTKMN
jgi:hypothetical protein